MHILEILDESVTSTHTLNQNPYLAHEASCGRFTRIVNWYSTLPPSTLKYFELSFLLPQSTFIIQRDAYDLSLEKQLSKNLYNKQTFKAIKL
jgi:hypothetical protein